MLKTRAGDIIGSTRERQALEPLAYRVGAASAVSGLSRSRMYELFASGELRSIKRGGCRLVLRSDLLAYLTGEAA